MDGFLDLETGECSFNSEQFKYLLAFVNRFPDKAEGVTDVLPIPVRIQNGEVLLIEDFLMNFESAQLYEEMFQGEIAYIGYPVPEGEKRHIISGAENNYAIVKKSENQDGAWKFIESVIMQSDGSQRDLGFPTRKDQLEKMIWNALDNNPTVSQDYGTIQYGSGNPNDVNWTYTYRAATWAEADLVLEVINEARLPPVMAEEIMKIIGEEAEAFYRGQKSVDEVAEIIQNRVSLYFHEQ